MVTVNSDHEELFGTDHAHLDLGVVDYDTPLFKRLVQYLSQAPLASAEIVSGAFRRLELNLDDSDTQSRGYTTSTLNGSKSGILPYHCKRTDIDHRWRSDSFLYKVRINASGQECTLAMLFP